MNLTKAHFAILTNRAPIDPARPADELLANAVHVVSIPDETLRNRMPMSDDQRKAMFAKMGGKGSSPQASRWYDREVLKAGARGFFEGANDAAEKGLAKLSFGLTDKIGFTDSTRPELQWWGYDAADQYAELARTALIGAMGLKAGTAAWNAWKAKQAAAAVAATSGTPTLEQAQKTVAKLRAAYRHVEADALIKRMGDAWPKYTGHISTHEDDLAALRQNPFQAWTDVYGNRASAQASKVKTNMNITTIPLLFLSNAVRVAHTPDEVLANAYRPLTDAQRKAMFASKRGGGSRGGGGSGGRTVSQAGAGDALRAAASQQVPAYDVNGNPLNLAARLAGPMAGGPVDLGRSGPAIMSPVESGMRGGSDGMSSTVDANGIFRPGTGSYRQQGFPSNPGSLNYIDGGGQPGAPGGPVPGSTAYLAQMNAGTPAGQYYGQLAASGIAFDAPPDGPTRKAAKKGKAPIAVGPGETQSPPMLGKIVPTKSPILPTPSGPKLTSESIHRLRQRIQGLL